MKIQILGTAAAERYPGLWCACEYCKRAKANGEIRRTAAYCIDNDTMVDFGPDIHWQVTEFGVDLTKIKRVFLTHSHGDHVSPIEFLWRKEWFSKAPGKIDVYGPPPVFAEILSFAARDSNLLSLEEDLLIRPHCVGYKMEVDSGDIHAFVLDANHAPGKQPLLYLITRHGKTVLIGNDSGWFPPQTWTALEGRKIDLAILDCTCGLVYPDADCGHMGANTVVKTWNKLREMGCLKNGARAVATHFSHNGGGSQAEYEAFFAPHGILTAYDGLVLDLGKE